MLLDSNIIIYAAQPEHLALQNFIRTTAPSVSAISRIQVLGYHFLNEPDRLNFEEFFNVAIVLPITESVISKAIQLRQQRRMSLGDCVIAGTALIHGLTLLTNDIADFQWIDGLALGNPLEPGFHESTADGEIR